MDGTISIAYMSSPLGWVRIEAGSTFVSSIRLVKDVRLDEQNNKIDNPVIELCIKELNEYFVGERSIFTVPIEQSGTEFQQKVWQELLQIPYGTTISYGEQARRLGDKNLMRAVGAANGKNKIWIVVPCHRVIASNGHLTGYAGGIDVKCWLLQHEQSYRKNKNVLF